MTWIITAITGLGPAPRRALLLVAVALAVVAVVAWLRADARADLKAELEANANKARIEHLKGAKDAETAIENLDDVGFFRRH